MADNADLRAAARVTGSGLDLDDYVVDFGHFLREQLLHEFRMRAGEEHLRPAIFAPNTQEDRREAIAAPQHFAREDRKRTRLNSSHEFAARNPPTDRKQK